MVRGMDPRLAYIRYVIRAESEDSAAPPRPSPDSVAADLMPPMRPAERTRARAAHSADVIDLTVYKNAQINPGRERHQGP